MANLQIEVRTSDPYTHIPNALIRDSRLRLQTRAVLMLMLSLPPDWDYSVRGMASVAGVGKDTMGRILQELEAAGYLRRRRQPREEGGRFGRTQYILTDNPSALFEDEEPGGEEPCPENEDTAPCPDLPCPENPCPVNPPQQSKEEQTKDYIYPPIVPPQGEGTVERPARKKRAAREAPEWKPERFAAFWEAWPRGENKQAAIRAWDRLRPDDALLQTMALAFQRQMASPMWQRGVGIPYASTWLNGRRWEDEPRAAESPGNCWAPDPEVT